MGAKRSSETSVDFQRTIRRYIPEVGTLHNNRFENLKPYTNSYFPEIRNVPQKLEQTDVQNKRNIFSKFYRIQNSLSTL
jgi:ribosomal protein L13